MCSNQRQQQARPGVEVRRRRRVFPYEEEYEDEYDWRRRRRQAEAGPEDEGDEEDEGEEEEEDGFLTCPRGTMFCMEMNQCSSTCGGSRPMFDNLRFDEEGGGLEEDDDEDDDDPDDYIICPRGTIFCMSAAQCLPSCGGPPAPLELGAEAAEAEDEDILDIDFLPQDEVVCPAGQVFCLQVMACVSNCGFFEAEEDGEGGAEAADIPHIDIEVTCPRGHVFCMTSNRCVPHDPGHRPPAVPAQVAHSIYIYHKKYCL